MLPPQGQQSFLVQMLTASGGLGAGGVGGNASLLRQLLNMNQGDLSSLLGKLGGGGMGGGGL